MKKWLMAVALVAALGLAGEAKAQFSLFPGSGFSPENTGRNTHPGPFGSPYGTPQAPPAPAVDEEALAARYGYHPLFKKIFRLSDKTTIGKKPAYLPPPPPPPANGGTLVFPTNPFIRSPRDFFMQDVP